MKTRIGASLLAVAWLAVMAAPVYAHSGGLDASGCLPSLSPAASARSMASCKALGRSA